MNLNEYVRNYYEAAGNYVYANPVPLDPKDTVLVLIDVQNDLTRDYFEAKWKNEGLNMEELRPVLDELGIYMGKAFPISERCSASAGKREYGRFT